MENEKMIPYFAHEGIVAKMERANRRLWILCIVLILLLAGTNGAWIYYESQFVDEVTIYGDESMRGGESMRSSYARRRDSMGRFTSRRGGMSYDDGMVEELRDLMDRAPDEPTRREFQKLITKLEQM